MPAISDAVTVDRANRVMRKVDRVIDDHRVARPQHGKHGALGPPGPLRPDVRHRVVVKVHVDVILRVICTSNDEAAALAREAIRYFDVSQRQRCAQIFTAVVRML